MDGSTVLSRMTPTPITTTYRVNLHTPRKSSPLNPAANKPVTAGTEEERQGRHLEDDTIRGNSRRARTVSPTQKILRRKAAKTLQTNTLQRQVEAYEAKALQGLTKKASASSKSNNTKKGKLKNTGDSPYKIGITVSSPTGHQPSKKKRRRRWGAFWVFFRARPVVTAFSSLWPFDSRPTQELEWRASEPQSPVAAASAA
ncbi:hypothetical protein NLU13_0691 [Sarocladium strictum]|uniref:Uncharacterized protein n=1 Tax=Sarocladium strictum TaxID=5046 RepID=A0AA39LBN5_SARSR|nr:hypothetical protein NLU13_0691 [Sarocladium strictum]